MRLQNCVLLLAGLVLVTVSPSQAVSLYEYYAPGGVVTTGLTDNGPEFILNGQEITIFSGSFHYFRVHPAYWRDTLRKIRAAGFNTVQTYVAWNLHEQRQGEFDFGAMGEDWSPFLDIRGFIEMAQEEDLFVSLRPGPYICAEWEFGGFPSWLLRDPTMHVRSYYDNFRVAAERYFQALLAELSGLQFVEGGPIISLQIENEFAAFGYDDEPRDLLYMEFLKEVVLASGYNQTLLYTSDNPTIHYDHGAIPGVLQTANFNNDPDGNLNTLELLQPGRPKMVTEFWTGWFDWWTAGYHTGWWVDEFAEMYEYVIAQGASINLYMFIGGTNFGFTAGANQWGEWPKYWPLVTSYDYDAPLTEAGDYGDKYWRVIEIISRLSPLQGIVDNPEPPTQRGKGDYGVIPITESIDFWTMVDQAPESFESLTGPVSMEDLPMNNMNGQSFGYLLYTATVAVAAPQSTLRIRGHVRDLGQIMIDGDLITQPFGDDGVDYDALGFWEGSDKTADLPGDGSMQRIDIFVENMGRINTAPPHIYKMQKKGIWEGPILLDGANIEQWTMTPFEFKQGFVNGLTGWSAFSGALPQPSLYRATFTIEGEPEDSFLDMSAWNKGVVFVNGFNLGRYWSQGPTLTLYVPAPVMVEGVNQIVVFEQYEAASEITFVTVPILGRENILTPSED